MPTDGGERSRDLDLMYEDYMLRCRVWALFSWAGVGLLMTAAWVVAVFDPHGEVLALLLALTGCATSAVAATLHIRSFLVKISTLVRANARQIGADSMNGPGVRPIR